MVASPTGTVPVVTTNPSRTLADCLPDSSQRPEGKIGLLYNLILLRSSLMNSMLVDRLATSAAMTDARRNSLSQLFSRLGDVAALPSSAQQVLRLTEQPDSDDLRDQLRDVIQADAGLVARILRRLNSSYFGLSHRVGQIGAAINLLGVKEIRNLTLTVFLSKTFEPQSDYASYRRKELWLHCVAVGAASRLVSRICGRGNPDEAYTAGLLHDIGLILIDQSLKRHFRAVLDRIDERTPTCQVENEILSFDHASLGGFVAEQWRFPPQIAEAIAWHHEPQNYQGEHRDLVGVVAIANYLCSRAGYTSLGVQNVTPPPNEVNAQLGLDQVSFSIICSELDATLQKAEDLARG